MKEIIRFHLALLKIFFSDLRSKKIAYFPSKDPNGFDKSNISQVQIRNRSEFDYKDVASIYYLDSVHLSKVNVITSGKFYISLFDHEKQEYQYFSLLDLPELMKDHSVDDIIFTSKASCYVVIASVLCNMSSIAGIIVHAIVPRI